MTPWPWRFEKAWIVSDVAPGGRPRDDKEIEYYGGFVIAETVTRENGPVLAAAPELLEALLEILPDGLTLRGDLFDAEGWLVKARAAIAKATAEALS